MWGVGVRSIVSVFCFALLWIGSAQAQTASVVPLQGDLSLNQGQGFERVDSRISANVGDSLMVGPGGAATLLYQDGCQVTIQPGSVTTVAPLSPCASGSFAQQNTNTDNLVGAAVVIGAIVGGSIYAAHTQQVQVPASP